MKLCIVVGATLALACSVVAGPVDDAESSYREALQELNIQYKLKLYELKGDYPSGSREAVQNGSTWINVGKWTRTDR